MTAARNVLLLGACAVASQLILFGTLPVLARLYTPDAFGAYTIFLGVTAIAGVFAGMRYESAAVLPRRDAAALALANLVLLLGAGVGVLLLAAGLLLEATTSGGYSGVSAAALGAVTAAAVSIGAIQRATMAWCTRAGRFLWLGVNQLAFNAGMVILQIAMAGGRSAGGLGLILGNTLALLLSTAALVLLVRRDSRGRLFARWSGRQMAAEAKRYRNFPSYMVPYALASTARERILHLMLGYFAGAAFLGRFAMSSRLAGAPNSLAYSAASPVFYSYASRAEPRRVAGLAGAMIEVSVVLMLPPFVAAMMEADVLAQLVLGPQWAGTGQFIRLLALPMLVLAATSWLDRLFDVHQRQRMALALEGGFTLFSLLLVGLLLAAGQPIPAVAAFAALSGVYYVLYAYLAFVANGLPGRALLRPAVAGLGLGVATAIVCILASAIAAPGSRLALYLLFWAIAAFAHYRWFGGREALAALFEGRARA